MKDKFTPNYIESLEENEVFVFGSNLDGYHIGGAARIAKERFGAVWGQGVGLQGKICYTNDARWCRNYYPIRQ